MFSKIFVAKRPTEMAEICPREVPPKKMEVCTSTANGEDTAKDNPRDSWEISLVEKTTQRPDYNCTQD